MTTALSNWQPQLSERIGRLSLPVLAARTTAGRVTYHPQIMAKKANVKVEGLDYSYDGRVYMAVGFIDAGNNSVISQFSLEITIDRFDNTQQFAAAVNSDIVAEALTRGYTGFTAADINWLNAPALLNNAPQSAITDAPADATTNYNILTTLLGTLTSAVNTANTKQNDIATRFNTLLAELRTLGLISA